MKEISYRPRKLAISKGETVTWTNDDPVEHDVTKRSGPGKDFRSGPPGGIAPRDSYSHTFKTPGQIAYLCTVHPGMDGTVTVK